MNSINWLEFMPFGQAIGWTIIHSLWQLTLIGLGLRLVLFILPQKKANTRYVVLLLGLLLAVISMGTTFSSEWSNVQQYNDQSSSASFQQEPGTEMKTKSVAVKSPTEEAAIVTPSDEKRTIAQQITTFSEQISPFIPIIAISWYIGVLFFSAFMIFGFFQLKLLKTRGLQLPTEEWQLRFDQLKKQMGIFRFVQFSISDRVQEPITFHFFKPVVLAPISIFSGLSTDQIEVLLLHELAHIRRHDYLVNIVQSMVEVLCFYHPTVWWISGKIREEREHCCDDLVLQVRNKPLLYAEALTQLQVFYHPLKTNLAMSAKGKKGTFSKRIFRLFGQYDQRPSIVKGSLIALLLLVSLLTQAFYAPSIITEDKLKGKNTTITTTALDATEDKTGISASLNDNQGRMAQEEANTIENDPKLLFDAVHRGNTEVVRLLIKQGIDVNFAKSDGRTPLIEAAHVSEFEVAQLLINKGANINQAAKDGYTALLEASEHGGFELVQFLLMHGADINHASEDGHTALLEAAENGHYDITSFLLENGADPNAKTKDGWDALREASANDHYRIIEYLQRIIKDKHSSGFIEPEISIDWSNSVNNSHYYADIWKQKDAAYLKTLHQLNRSCSDMKRAPGKTKIISNQGKENSLIFTLKFGNQVGYDTLKNCVHPDNEMHQNTAELKEVLYPPNRLYLPKGGLPSYVKIFNLKSPIVEQLEIFIKLAKDVAHLRVGLLDEKTQNLRYEITDDYIERGSNQMAWNLANRNVENGTYWLVVEVDDYSLKQLVLVGESPKSSNAEDSCQDLLRAVKLEDVAKVRELLKTTNPNCEYREDGEARSPLVAAARNGNLEIGKLIMAAKGKVGYHTKGDETPLMAAARNGHLDFVKFLIGQGANVNKKLAGDGTALIGAVRGRHFDVAKILLENGANPYTVSSGDEYAMYHARMNKDKDMIKLLQEYEKGK